MKLHKYLDTLETAQRLTFAADAGIDDKYLAQLKSASKTGAHRFPSWRLCHRFIELSRGKLTIEDLRPDVHDKTYVRPDKMAAA